MVFSNCFDVLKYFILIQWDKSNDLIRSKSFFFCFFFSDIISPHECQNLFFSCCCRWFSIYLSRMITPYPLGDFGGKEGSKCSNQVSNKDEFILQWWSTEPILIFFAGNKSAFAAQLSAPWGCNITILFSLDGEAFNEQKNIWQPLFDDNL